MEGGDRLESRATLGQIVLPKTEELRFSVPTSSELVLFAPDVAPDSECFHSFLKPCERT